MPNNKIHPGSAAASARKALKNAGVSLSIAQTTLPQRLEKRRAHQHLTQQSNIEAILAKALKLCEQSTSDHALDPDWLTAFIEFAEQTSNPEMQRLWALVFSKEAAMSGSFSIRSMRALKDLTRKDADIFQLAVTLCSRTPGDRSLKIILGCYHPPTWRMFGRKGHQTISLNRFGMPYSNILWMMEHGLVYNSELETSALSTENDYQLKIGQDTLCFRPNVQQLKLRYYRLTPVGDELAKLVLNEGHSGYTQQLIEMLESVMSPIEA
ncbi:TIGR03899 family protein [Echinimonas agarilytica]|uniref:TIGR03899 family protein n=1 Tax=Echinimonas agarilytica TaxID=1215918 RepID=A0AA41W4X0_9GAMM|nr:TIGR03899 family protein [Echinimonas agarilytica]MCM2678734.1 TIGR03899 family protein [Echinimonas agarilytica]